MHAYVYQFATFQGIEVNSESIKKSKLLKDKSLNMCQSLYKKKYRKNVFYWLCPGFYNDKKHLQEYKVSKLIEQFLDFKHVGYANQNKHIIEMSKSNPTQTTYNHFGYISNYLEFPIKLNVYNRFKIFEDVVLIRETIKQVYKALFCKHNKHLEFNKASPQKMGHKNEVLYNHIDLNNISFWRHNNEKKIGIEKVEDSTDESRVEDEHILEYVDDICVDNERDNEEDEEYDELEDDGNKEAREAGDKESVLQNTSMVDDHVETKEEEEISHIHKLSNETLLKNNIHLNSIKSDANEKTNDSYKNENSNSRNTVKPKLKYVLVEESQKVNKIISDNKSIFNFTKKFVIISFSIFYGNLKNLIKITIFFFCVLVLMCIILIIFYIYTKKNDDILVILKEDEEIQDMPKHFKRLLKHLSNDEKKRNMMYFKNYMHKSNPF